MQSRKRGSIVSREFHDAFARKLVFYLKRFPPLLQVKLLVRNRFTGSLALELVVGRWEKSCSPNAYIKYPCTAEGLLAITMLAVNFSRRKESSSAAVRLLMAARIAFLADSSKTYG